MAMREPTLKNMTLIFRHSQRSGKRGRDSTLIRNDGYYSYRQLASQIN